MAAWSSVATSLGHYGLTPVRLRPAPTFALHSATSVHCGGWSGDYVSQPEARSATLVDFHERREKAHQLLNPSVEGDYIPFSEFAVDLLPHWDEVWVEPEREAYRQLRLHVLESLSERSTRHGRFAEAIESALLAMEGAPLRESAHLALIRALAAEGNRGEALVRYSKLCALLDQELGVEPSFQFDDVLSESVETG